MADIDSAPSLPWDAFLAALDTLPAAVCLHGSDLSLRFANRRFRAAFGRACDEDCCHSIWDAQDPSDCPPLRVLETGEPEVSEAKGAHGRKYRVFSGLMDSAAGPLVVSMAFDHTNHDKPAEEMAVSEERHRALVESADVALFVIDAEGKVSYVNGVSARMFQGSRGGLIGRAVAELFPPKVSENMILSIAKVLKTGEAGYFENFVSFPTGSRWLATWLMPLKGDDGSANGVLGISRDITDRRRAIREHQDRTAEVANRLKTPLTAILGYAALLEKAEPEELPELAKTVRARVRERVRELDAILETLLGSLTEQA